MDSIIGLVEFVIAAVVVLIALFLILLVVVSRLPPDNPLRQVLKLLIARIGATAAAGALAIPIEPIPGLDVLYDIGVPALLIFYWYTFFRKVGPAWSNASAPRRSSGPTIDHDPR
jgi:amino acid transporter